MTQIELALKNVSKFSNLALAKSFSERIKSWPNVLLGDDGKYWVPATLGQSVLLEKAGYEIAN